MCVCVDENNDGKKVIGADKKTLRIFNELLSHVAASKDERFSVKSFSEQNCQCGCMANRNTKKEIEKTKKAKEQNTVTVKKTENSNDKKQIALSVSSGSVSKKIASEKVNKPIVTKTVVESNKKEKSKESSSASALAINKGIAREIVKPAAVKITPDYTAVDEKERAVNEADTKKEIKEFFAMKNASAKQQVASSRTSDVKKTAVKKKNLKSEDKDVKTFEPIVVDKSREIEIVKSPEIKKSELVKVTQTATTDAKMASLSERLSAIRGTSESRAINVTSTSTAVQDISAISQTTEVQNTSAIKEAVMLSGKKSENVSEYKSGRQEAYQSESNTRIENDFIKETEYKNKKSVKQTTQKKNTGKYDEGEVQRALAGLLKTMTITQRQNDEE